MSTCEVVQPTLSLDDAADAAWNVIVIGAGPAGAVAARCAAERGRATLLIDRQRFPRSKVCGCCLNGAALAILKRVGLGQLPTQLGASPLSRVRVTHRRTTAELRLPAGVALSRSAFDAALIRDAIRSGAAFLPETTARVGPVSPLERYVKCEQGGASATLRTKVAIAADGLAGSALRDCDEIQSRISRGARVAGGTILDACVAGYEPGVIHMAVGSGGYAGLVRLETGELDVAAAFDVATVRQYGGLARAAAAVLGEAGLPAPPGFVDSRWTGTPPLTRARTPLGAARLLLVGDCAGYVEPFTGEGMGWAIQSAVAVQPYVERTLRNPTGTEHVEWTRSHARTFNRRRQFCAALAAVLRSATFTQIGVRLLRHLPFMARPHLAGINSPALAE